MYYLQKKEKNLFVLGDYLNVESMESPEYEKVFKNINHMKYVKKFILISMMRKKKKLIYEKL